MLHIVMALLFIIKLLYKHFKFYAPTVAYRGFLKVGGMQT